MAVKKLIEVALPLEAINAESSREKQIRFGHPSTLHLWWARRPLASARAVIWASLVDDPSSHPDQFPTEDDQNTERERLFGILRQLVLWKNSTDETVLESAKAEIEKSVGQKYVALLDPFAGGGTIPFEAQRLGLDVYAQDLNPVAVVINKAMVEVPPLFSGRPPVNPEITMTRFSDGSWPYSSGLAEDVKYYGKQMRDEAFKRIGGNYPEVQLPTSLGGGVATPIAWLWGRTIECPNPACRHETVLAKSFALSNKRGNEWHIHYDTKDGQLTFEVLPGRADQGETVNRTGATCVHCGTAISFPYIREQAKSHKLGNRLMAIVVDTKHGRRFVKPSEEQVVTATQLVGPEEIPSCALSGKARGNVSLYGFDETCELFTTRQQIALTTYAQLVGEVQKQVCEDALARGMSYGKSLKDDGDGAFAYSQAVALYLALGVSRLTDICNSLCRWEPVKTQVRNMFGRQAIPMVWNYAENNVFAGAAGDYETSLGSIIRVINTFRASKNLRGHVRQFDAQSDSGIRNVMVSTDPPYYDNIDYADLSDYFYVWLRKSLKDVFPELFTTIATPKKEELIASAYRHPAGTTDARDFFENGMLKAFEQIARYSTSDYPLTVYYAFKQSETETKNDVEQTASTGWETMLSAIIKSGFTITGTWPMRTELTVALKNNQNVLASSIVLVCRKRADDALPATRRDFVNALRRELRPAIDKLRTSNIAPVDMAQSAIGPGIGVYSRFSKVLEADGTEMTVRSALQIINHELDLYFSDQDSDLDRESRCCVELYTQFAFDDIRFGDADNLARAKNTSVEAISSHGAMLIGKGSVRLLGRDELREMPDPDFCWLFTQQLTHAMETDGIEECAKLLKDIYDGRAENARALAYRLFTIADKKGWNQEAFAYNSLVVAWRDIESRAAQLKQETPVQTKLDI